MADVHKNFSYSTVATAPSPAASGTSLVVAAGDGALFPAVPFNATIWPTGANPTAATAEIVRVTTVATDTFTITRAQESTSARTVIVGDQIAATITTKTLTDAEGYDLNYTEVTTGQGSITTIVDMTNMSIACTTPTLPAGKYVWVEMWVAQVYSTVITDRIAMHIREGTTDLVVAYGTAANWGWGGVFLKCRLSPTPGAHTYKGSMARDVGTGSATWYAGTEAKAYIRARVE